MGAHQRPGKSDEWYTPAYVFDALGCTFDLDVAAPPQATNVPAREVFFRNSLEREWHGFVRMNPPFGKRNGLIPWLDKFIAHENGVALVPDRTSAPWFQNAARKVDRLLFVAGKIKFIRPDGTTGDWPGDWPGDGTCLMSLGTQGYQALERAGAAGLGFVCEIVE